MRYQLLALDLDGTTLQDDHQLNPTIKSVIDKIKSHYSVMIVTGRHHTAAKPYYDELGLDTPILCCNGTYLYDYKNEKVLFHNGISKVKAQTFLALAHQYQLKMVIYTKEAMTYSLADPIEYMQPLEVWAKTYPKDLQPNIYQVESFEPLVEQSDYIWKFVVQGEQDKLKAFLSLPFIVDNFDGAWSAENRIDLAAKGNTKGNALANYAESIGISAEHIIAAGDNFNDVSMLSFSGIGIAMQHAHDDVKAWANVITKTDNQGDGLAKLIAHYFPIDGLVVDSFAKERNQ